MPTFNQLVKQGRQDKVYKSKAPVLQKGFNSLNNAPTDQASPQKSTHVYSLAIGERACFCFINNACAVICAVKIICNGCSYRLAVIHFAACGNDDCLRTCFGAVCRLTGRLDSISTNKFIVPVVGMA